MNVVLEKMRLVSVVNAREHWRTKRARESHQVAELHYGHGRDLRNVELPCTIELVRSGPMLLDDDNLRPAFKHIRDYLATKLLPEATQGNQHGRRGDDSDERLTWKYRQQKGPYAVEIRITD